MPTRLYQLIYCSRNAIRGGQDDIEAEIQQILSSARRNNQSLGVTGALMFTDNCFVQALEGRHDTLEAVFEKIQCDERHRDVTVLAFEEVSERQFGGWDMAWLGGPTPGTPATIAAMTLNEAFRRKSAKAEHILRMMQDVVDRQAMWAGAETGA